MTVWLRASPFNITTIQVYAPTSNYDDSAVDEFYRELQSLLGQMPSRTFWLYKVIGTRRLEKVHKKVGEKFVDLSTIRRGSPGLPLRSLIFVTKGKTLRKREASQK